MPNLFIIGGCNGSGKTTASFSLLPEALDIKEFVNADEIARGLSPFQPETVSLEAGKIMLRRIDDLLLLGQDFAFETTLSTRSFVSLCKEAKQRSYEICLIYYWLETPELAVDRVASRVKAGGHHIPAETIIRRYYRGLKNFRTLYKEVVDSWFFINNSSTNQEVIAEGKIGSQETVFNRELWMAIQKYK